MIVAEIKPFEEIKVMLKDYKRILILGCGTCTTVCLSGGKKQVEILASALRIAKKVEGDEIQVGEKTILRQCDPEFIDNIKDDLVQYDVILSMACGAGVQALAEGIEGIPVLPALNTVFIGVAEDKGVWSERCLACGECILWRTGGICPVTRCAKSLTSGPCGGSQKGLCEVSKNTPCVWQLIYSRLKKLNQLNFLREVPTPKTKPIHPRKVIREDLRLKKETSKGV
jgi:ferredoxin